jgi:hypothetical protein
MPGCQHTCAVKRWHSTLRGLCRRCALAASCHYVLVPLCVGYCFRTGEGHPQAPTCTQLCLVMFLFAQPPVGVLFTQPPVAVMGHVPFCTKAPGWPPDCGTPPVDGDGCLWQSDHIHVARLRSNVSPPALAAVACCRHGPVVGTGGFDAAPHIHFRIVCWLLMHDCTLPVLCLRTCQSCTVVVACCFYQLCPPAVGFMALPYPFSSRC